MPRGRYPERRGVRCPPARPVSQRDRNGLLRSRCVSGCWMQRWTEVDDFGAQERAPKSEVRVQGEDLSTAFKQGRSGAGAPLLAHRRALAVGSVASPAVASCGRCHPRFPIAIVEGDSVCLESCERSSPFAGRSSVRCQRRRSQRLLGCTHRFRFGCKRRLLRIRYRYRYRYRCR